MEIRKINNKIINGYPKINEFNKKDFKKHVQRKWAKTVISSFVFWILMKSTKSKASVMLSGDFIFYREVNPKYELLNKGSGIFKVLSIVLLILSLILATIKKYKNKEGLNTKLTNRKMIILYIVTAISIIAFVTLMIMLNTVPKYL